MLYAMYLIENERKKTPTNRVTEVSDKALLSGKLQ
jgi:hypothetical protein